MDKRTELSSQNLHQLVEAFYLKVWKDELIGPKFSHVDFKHHLPKMVNFWSTIIFSQGTYTGSPFDKHIPLGIGPAHFERWLDLFNETVLEYFKGDTAEEIIKRANVIGLTFQHKLRSLQVKP